jgi:hypothetical protein
MPFVKKNAKKNRARLIQKIYPVKYPKGNPIKISTDRILLCRESNRLRGSTMNKKRIGQKGR